MEKNADRELWILHSVAKYRFPLDALATDNGVAFTLNMKWHELKFDELVNTLCRLFDKGDLIAERVEQRVRLGEFVPTRDEVISGLSYLPPKRLIKSDASSGSEIYYGLTTHGGERWEAVARPDWNRFVDASIGLDPNDGIIIASNRTLVEKFLALNPYISTGISVIAGSERWDLLEPWEATYWKTLPRGHRVTYDYKLQEESRVIQQSLEVSQFLEEINNWFTRF